MTDTTTPDGRRRRGVYRSIAWGGAAAVILLPLAAMQLAPGSGVNWTLSDFIFATVVIGGVGLAFDVAVRISSNWSYRAGAAVGLAAGFLLIWSNAAVGYIGDDTLYNIVFFVLVALAFLGALIVRLRAQGMAIVMLAAGIAHGITGGIGFPHDPVTGPITLAFTAMWLTSAWLFHKAAREGATG